MEHGRRRQPASGIKRLGRLPRKGPARVVATRHRKRAAQQISQNSAFLFGKVIHAQREECIQALSQPCRSLAPGPRQLDTAIIADPKKIPIRQNAHRFVDIGRLQHQQPRGAHREHPFGFRQGQLRQKTKLKRGHLLGEKLSHASGRLGDHSAPQGDDMGLRIVHVPPLSASASDRRAKKAPAPATL